MKTFFIILLFISLTFDLQAYQWEKITGTLPTVSAQTMSACGNEILGGFNYIYKSRDHGSTWEKVDQREWHILNFAVYGNKIYCCGYGDILISTDNGDTWNYLAQNLVQSNIFCVVESVGKIFAGTNDELWVSENNGSHWSKVDLGYSQITVNSLFADSRYLIAGTSGGLFVSEDNGVTWDTNIACMKNLYVYCMKAKGNNIFLGEAGGVYKLTNVNGNWSTSLLTMPGYNVMQMAVSGSYVFAGTFSNGLFYSYDDGNTWLDLNTGLDYMNITGLAANSDYVFACCTQPMSGGWTYSLYRMPLSVLDVRETNQPSGIEVFPNPANDILTVKMPVMANQTVSWSVANLLGTKIINGSKQLSNGGFIINVSGLNDGVYFLNVSNENINIQKKLVVIK